MNSKAKAKVQAKMCALLLAVVVFFGQVGPSLAEIQWAESLVAFERFSPVYTATVEPGTPKDALALPGTLRAIAEIPPEMQAATFEQAMPELTADENGTPIYDCGGYSYTAPGDAQAVQVAGQTAVYALNAGENGGETAEYRAYGSLAGSENQWFACDETGNLTGAVVEVPVTWAGDYDAATAGEYTLKASVSAFSAYRWDGEAPTAVITVPESQQPEATAAPAENGENTENAENGQNGDNTQNTTPQTGETAAQPTATPSATPAPTATPGPGSTAAPNATATATPTPAATATPETAPIELAEGTLQTQADGINFSVSGKLPKNATLTAEKIVMDTTQADSLLSGVIPENAALKDYNAYDIRIEVNGTEWQPAEPLKVTVDSSILPDATAEKIYVAHIAGGTATEVQSAEGDAGEGATPQLFSAAAEDETDDAEENENENGNENGGAANVEALPVTVEDGRVTFTATSFSPYMFYSIDFHYGTLTYRLEKGETVLLSVLFNFLDIERTVDEVTNVVFSDPSLVKVEKVAGSSDWQLTALNYFQSSETLTLYFNDGTELVVYVIDPAYIGDVPIKTVAALDNVWRVPTGVTQIGTYKVAGVMGSGAKTYAVPASPAGTTLAHCKYQNAAYIQGRYYDVEVQTKLMVPVTNNFAYCLEFGTNGSAADSRYYLRSFINQANNITSGTEIVQVTLTFYYAGTSYPAEISALGYGNTCWTNVLAGGVKPDLRHVEFFNFEDCGYKMYSTDPSKFIYNNTYKAWQLRDQYEPGDWTVLWSYFINRSSFTMSQSVNFNGVSSGLELVLGISQHAESVVTVQKQVKDASLTLGSTDFTFKVEPSLADGTPSNLVMNTVTNPNKTQGCASNSITTIGGFGNATYQMPGTYYNLITETPGNDPGHWTYDTGKWIQKIVISQNIDTLALSADVSYKKIGATGDYDKAQPLFLNIYYAAPAKSEVLVNKQVRDASNTIGNTDFTFTVTSCDANGTVNNDHVVTTPSITKTFTPNANRTVAGFGYCDFTEPGTYYNLIAETIGADTAHWDYDTTKWLQIVVVGKDTTTGKLGATVTYKALPGGTESADYPRFINVYYGPVSTEVRVKKTVTDSSIDSSAPAQDFTFTVTASNGFGVPVPTHTITNATKTQSFTTGTATTGPFGNCTFDKAGLYYNLITETDDGAAGWAYDATRYLQQISVRKDTSTGKMAATVTYKEIGGTTVTIPAFTNDFAGFSAVIQVQKIVSNYDASMAGQLFIVNFSDGLTAQFSLEHNETSKPMVANIGSGKTFDVSEVIPMEYGLTGISITDTGTGTQKPTLTLTKDATGQITGAQITLYNNNNVLITVTNQFTHKSYFKARTNVKNTLNQ
ncbi:MAG: FctA domain-containing protein [Gemmiger sp.]|nr:FctA domain-containing protein [Gemmiger sp.]